MKKIVLILASTISMLTFNAKAQDASYTKQMMSVAAILVYNIECKAYGPLSKEAIQFVDSVRDKPVFYEAANYAAKVIESMKLYNKVNRFCEEMEKTVSPSI